jgi:hypothetical protein
VVTQERRATLVLRWLPAPILAIGAEREAKQDAPVVADLGECRSRGLPGSDDPVVSQFEIRRP